VRVVNVFGVGKGSGRDFLLRQGYGGQDGAFAHNAVR